MTRSSLLALCLAFASSWAHASEPERHKLDVGLVLPLSGPQAAFGQEALRGVEVALDMAAAADPTIPGRVRLLRGDDLSTAKGATDAATNLITKERAHVVIGSVASAATVAAAEVARQRQVPMVAMIASRGSTTLGGSPIFRATFDDVLEGKILAEFALGNLGVKKAATLRDDALMSEAFTKSFQDAFKAGGGAVVAQEIYDLGADSHAAVLKRLADSGAEVVVTPAAAPTAALLITEARKVAPRLKFLGGDSWDTKTLAQNLGAAAPGNYFIAHFATDDSAAAVSSFVQAFTKKYGRAPGVLAALGFDAMSLTLDAFKRANSNLKGPLASALARTESYHGVTGDLTLIGGPARKSGIVKELTASGSRFKARVMPPAPTQQASAKP